MQSKKWFSSRQQLRSHNKSRPSSNFSKWHRIILATSISASGKETYKTSFVYHHADATRLHAKRWTDYQSTNPHLARDQRAYYHSANWQPPEWFARVHKFSLHQS